MNSTLTVEKLKAIALKNYEVGGHRIIECWTDEDIKNWIKEGNSYKELKSLIDLYNF